MHDLVLTLALQLGVLLLLSRAAPRKKEEERDDRRSDSSSHRPTLDSAQRMIEREYGAGVSQESDYEGY